MTEPRVTLLLFWIEEAGVRAEEPGSGLTDITEPDTRQQPWRGLRACARAGQSNATGMVSRRRWR